MRVLVDENMGSRRLAERLRAAGHDVVLATDVGLLTVSDARVLTWAVGAARPVLTRDHEDFADLHDLVRAVGGHHPGILSSASTTIPAQPDRARDRDGADEPGVFGLGDQPAGSTC